MDRTRVGLQRRITAFHEAGHAVVAFRFSIAVDVVALCDTGPLGYVRFRRASFLSALPKDFSGTVPWPLVVREAEERAMFFLAGPLSEAKLLGAKLRSHCCESDLRTAQFLCDTAHNYCNRLRAKFGDRVPDIDPVGMANRLCQRTARVVAQPANWRAIAALAADLEAWSRLSGDDAADTVQWTRRIREQLALLLPTPRYASSQRAPGVAGRNLFSHRLRPIMAPSPVGSRVAMATQSL